MFSFRCQEKTPQKLLKIIEFKHRVLKFTTLGRFKDPGRHTGVNVYRHYASLNARRCFLEHCEELWM